MKNCIDYIATPLAVLTATGQTQNVVNRTMAGKLFSQFRVVYYIAWTYSSEPRLISHKLIL